MSDDSTFALKMARIRRALLPVFLIVVGLLVIGLAAQTVADPISDAASGEAKIAAGISVSMVLVGSWMLWRASSVRVVITRSEVILRNMGGTRRIPFSEVAGFETMRTNEFGRPRTVLRLKAGRHGIPRSVPASGASTETLTGAWVTLLFSAMAASGGGGRDATSGATNGRVTFAPGYVEKVPRGVAELIAEMNAALDRRRGSAEQTAGLLAAAHPKFRTMLHDD